MSVAAKNLIKEEYMYNPITRKDRPRTRETSGRPATTADDSVSEDNKRKPLDLLIISKLHENFFYPKNSVERATYRTEAGKRITPHQWAVYDFACTIPCGKVTTYKDVSEAVGGSPRSVGSALRNNPFAPFVPCHRVIASTLFIGGFFGEWGADDKTGKRYYQKVDMLAHEGVLFSNKGLLENPDLFLWRG